MGALTPAEDGSVPEIDSIHFEEKDLSQDEFETMSPKDYEHATRHSRASSIRSMKGDEKKNFDTLSVYNDTLVEDVVGIGDVTTPASPLTPQKSHSAGK